MNMKRIIITAMFMIPVVSFSQKNNLTEVKKPNLNLEMLGGGYGSGYSKTRIGPVMMLGGGAMFLAGILTVPMNSWRGTPVTSPYVKSTPRFMGMVMGITTFSVGTVITISGN